jgi:hypothetical protein
VLHSNGGAIELSTGNSREVAAAVAELKRSLPARKPGRQLSPHERLAQLDKRCRKLAGEFEEISKQERHGENWLLFTEILMRWSAALRRIEQENGIA